MRRNFLVLLSMIIVTSLAYSQVKVTYNSLEDMMPIDKDITIGTLDNGMKYYIKENNKPENRAELQMMIKAGSILEEDNQAGLAHFLEHMCFNGTKNFPKQELVSFLEATGMRFGADVNANTGFDRTYYMITIPLDKEGLLEKGMQVLEDWLHNVTLDPEEIEKERGVILEEWRLYRGAQERLMRAHFPYLLHNSLYADRLPIGDTNVILNAPPERFSTFYKDWYRPNLSAIFAVGDFDKNEIEKMIKEKFGKIKNPKNPKPRTEFDIPGHKETLVSIAKDKELTYPNVSIYYKHPAMKEGSFFTYRKNMVNSLLSMMFNQRLQELTRKSDPAFVYAGGGEGRFVGNMASFSLVAVTKADGILTGMESVIAEANRAMQHGFTPGEFERAKKDYMRNIEKAFEEKDKTESVRYAREYSRNFLFGEGIPGIEYELAVTKEFLPAISLEEANKMFGSYVTKENLVIAISAPDKEGIVVPTKDEVLAKYKEASNKKYEAYKDEVSSEPLFGKKVTPGTIVKESKIDKIGVTEFKLSNGARVFLKPTDFKNDEILFRAYSPGGTSLASDKMFMSADYASSIINEAGIANFSATTLEKMLAGKSLRINPNIGELTEGFNGSTSPKDLETFMQLVNLYFTEPRLDYESFESFMVKMKENVANRQMDPKTTARDTFSVTMSNYHYRSLPITAERLAMVDADDAYDFYKDRFADAGDFTFFFVGSFKVDEMKPFITKYLASLPSQGRQESWKDVGEETPKGKITKAVKKGIEQQSSVMLAITGDFKFNRQNRHDLKALMQVYNIKLRESIREEKGGVYGIRAMGRPAKYPDEEYIIYVMFGCDPKRVDELIDEVKRIAKELQDNEPEESYVKKAKEIFTREYETNLKENRYWMSAIYQYDYNKEDMNLIPDYLPLIEKTTGKDIQKAAKKYLNMKNFVRVVLYPEN